MTSAAHAQARCSLPPGLDASGHVPAAAVRVGARHGPAHGDSPDGNDRGRARWLRDVQPHWFARVFPDDGWPFESG